MEKEFVTQPLALRMKALGFDEPCFTYYYNDGILSTTPRESGDDIKYQGDCKFDNHQNSYLEDDDDCSAPLFQQAFRWFREKYNLRGFIGFRPNVKQFDCHIYDMSLSGKEYVRQRTMEEFNKDPKVGTYEEAELACLEKLIEIAESNGKEEML